MIFSSCVQQWRIKSESEALFCHPTFNDNLTSVLLAGPAILPVLPLAKFNFDILVLRKDPYCILLLSAMPVVDAAQKKDDEIQLMGSWDLGVLFQKVIPSRHNAGRVLRLFPKYWIGEQIMHNWRVCSKILVYEFHRVYYGRFNEWFPAKKRSTIIVFSLSFVLSNISPKYSGNHLIKF